MDMSYAFLAFAAVFVGVMFLQSRVRRARPADFEAMRAYVQSRGLRVVAIQQNNNHWRYWLRGRIRLSNLARTFVLVADSPDGMRSEIHFAFDPWSQSGQLQVLSEETQSAVHN
jgi:hypothetical protein